ncbi:hypothetical protein CU669_03835 [Paramagnetospirillum kuznetsovii]|uniref:Uncharacterized protein n=1 Tax=Paramagnetospirillum kuznetsovii TaxID=2053833 RepID=A0A364P2F7_9PROT|nr:hypothetical protein CU669_03835 [Paramagnetospirillum kuznetsovii]
MAGLVPRLSGLNSATGFAAAEGIDHQDTKSTKRAEQTAKPHSFVMAGRVPAIHAVPHEIPMKQ